MDDSSYLYISIGGNLQGIQVAALKEEIEFNPPFLRLDGQNPIFDLRLRLMNNRLFIKTIFKDVQREEVVGIIDFDKWSLVSDNVLNWFSTDSTFEVLDRGNNVIFGMAYKPPNVIYLKGYYVVPKFICVFYESMVFFPKGPNKEDAFKRNK